MARVTIGALTVGLCLFGASACGHSKDPGTGQSVTSVPSNGSPGSNQAQPQQEGTPGGSLPSLGTPFTPSGHPSTSLPPLGGSGS